MRMPLRQRLYRRLGFFRVVWIREKLNRATKGKVGLHSTVAHYSSGPAAKVIRYAQYSDEMKLKCSVCGWSGTAAAGEAEYSDVLDISCPRCQKMLLVVGA